MTEQTMEPPTYLATINAHPRDSHISFDEGPHIYTIDGESDYTSVTTWNHSHFPHFDSDKIIDTMMSSKKWPNTTYFGKTKEEIKKLWSDNGKKASEQELKCIMTLNVFIMEWCQKMILLNTITL